MEKSLRKIGRTLDKFGKFKGVFQCESNHRFKYPQGKDGRCPICEKIINHICEYCGVEKAELKHEDINVCRTCHDEVVLSAS